MFQLFLKSCGMAVNVYQSSETSNYGLDGWWRDRGMTMRWVSERLRMGHGGNVSRGGRRLTRNGVRQVEQMKATLERMNRKEQ
jgi:hypothetical protein